MDDKIISTLDYAKRTVNLKKSTFEEHICDGHPEMADNCHAIKEAVETPEVVYESNQSPKREVFFSRVKSSSYPRLYTKVVVEYNNPYEGTIKSSWFEKSITGVMKEGIKYVGKNK